MEDDQRAVVEESWTASVEIEEDEEVTAEEDLMYRDEVFEEGDAENGQNAEDEKGNLSAEEAFDVDDQEQETEVTQEAEDGIEENAKVYTTSYISNTRIFVALWPTRPKYTSGSRMVKDLWPEYTLFFPLCQKSVTDPQTSDPDLPFRCLDNTGKGQPLPH